MKNLHGLRVFIEDLVSGHKQLTRYKLTPNNVYTLSRVYNNLATTGTGRFFGDIENMSPIFTRYGFTVKEVSGCVCTYDVR